MAIETIPDMTELTSPASDDQIPIWDYSAQTQKWISKANFQAALGVTTVTSINKVTLTQPATGSTLTIADGKTLTSNASLTLAGTDGKSLTLTGSLTVPADMTAAGVGYANVFTAGQAISTSVTGGAIGTVFQQQIVNTGGAVGDWSGLTFRWIANNANTNQAYIGSVITSLVTNGLSDLVFGVKESTAFTAITEYMRLKGGGHLLINTTTDSGQLTVNQSSTTAAIPALHLTQADLSEGFIDFAGTSAASAAGPLSSWTTGNAIQGHVAVEINGTRRWLRFYDDPTS